MFLRFDNEKNRFMNLKKYIDKYWVEFCNTYLTSQF